MKHDGAGRFHNIDTALVDLADAIASADFEPPHPSRDGMTLETQRRVVLECMRTCAGAAYMSDLGTVPDIGKLRFDTGMSTTRLKFWTGSSGGVLSVVLGFSGTRMDDMGDLLCDVRSQLARPHVNIFDERLPALGKVGAGWQDWWRSEALQPRQGGARMRAVLECYSETARESGKALSVSLSGHSLGAAVATLAGFDIGHLLRATGGAGKVSVYAFNPPRTGPKGVETQYMSALKNAMTSEDSALRFALRQFCRARDPIQSTPLFMHHPHWGNDVHRDGAGAGDRFAQFATCTDQAASPVNLAANHELDLWRDYFACKMSDVALQTLFEAPTATSDASRISRRQLLNLRRMYR